MLPEQGLLAQIIKAQMPPEFTEDLNLCGIPVFVTAVLLQKDVQKILGLSPNTVYLADVVGLAIDAQGAIVRAVVIPEWDVENTRRSNGQIDWGARKRIAIELFAQIQ